jgi:hypothetical protein
MEGFVDVSLRRLSDDLSSAGSVGTIMPSGPAMKRAAPLISSAASFQFDAADQSPSRR